MAFLNSFTIAAALGTIAHLGLFIRGEWHMQAAAILIFHLSAHNLLWFLSMRATGSTLLSALYHTLHIDACYLCALYTSIVLYRLVFHRVCGFPGPVLARCSKLWHAWEGRRSQNHILLDKLHQRYGDFVRTGPAEVTVFDAAGFEAICGQNTKCTRTVWYDFGQPNYSIISVRDEKVHDKRRRVWSPAFSTTALHGYEPRVLNNVRKALMVIDSKSAKGAPVDTTNLAYWLAFDIMGEFAFAESFHMLDNSEYHESITLLRRAFKLLGPLSPVLWLARMGFSLAPNVWRIRDWNGMMSYCHDMMKKRVTMKPEQSDISSFLIKDAEKNGFTDRDRKFLNGDAVTIIIGGSDSSAPTLTFCLYNLAKYPEHAEKVYQEIVDLDTQDAMSLQNLPHLNAVIEETLRIYPALPTAVQRETPPEGIEINGRRIPGNTVVVVPRYTIGRRELYFEKADQFIPERWYSRPELVRNRAAHVPFSIGKGRCIGKSLAMMDLRFMISAIVRRYHLSFVPGSNPDLVHIEMQDHFTVAPGPLSLIYTPRD